MDLPELQRRVDRLAKVDLHPLYDAYIAQGGGDIEGFLAYLGKTKALDGALLKELHGMTDVETPTLDDPAYGGTLLAEWAKTRVPGATGVPRPAPAPVAIDPATPVSNVHFRAISRLGEGAMGAIDIARDVYLRRKVALKTVLPGMASHPQILGRFLCEMQITAQLEHPNIVPVYALDVGDDGSLGYAMKLVQGKDLAEILDEAHKRTGAGEPLGEELGLEKRLEHFIKVCDALEYAHSKGIVHRDLKPANVMIGRHNEVYLMDWGIARVIGGGEQAVEAGFDLPQQDTQASMSGSRTRIGEVIGTPNYMSPEQAAGKNHELDARSDQYAMGLILQECVTLQTAVEGQSLHEILTKAMLAKRDPVTIGTGPGELPREIDAIVRKATRPDPKDRYPSVRALADEVRRYLHGEPVQALPEGAVRRAGRWLSKHRMATLTLLLAIGLVGAGGTIGSVINGRLQLARQYEKDARITQMTAEAAIQSQLVERQLARYEAALSEFVGAAQIVLSKQPPSDVAPYFEESFASKETAPPDLGPSKRYGRDVSVLAPLTSLTPGTAREPLEPLLHSLGLLGPSFRALFLESSGAPFRTMSPATQRGLIADVGVPAFHASLGLHNGITLSFPGMTGRPPGDPRESEKLVEGKAGIVWGTPTTVGGESILPARAAVHDERGTFRGVALLQVSLSRILAWPEGEDLDYVQSRMLVGRDGKIIAEEHKEGGPVPLAPEVAAAIAEGKSGSLVAEVNGRRYRYTYHPLSSLDWYYVTAAEEGRVEKSKGKIETSDPRKVIAAASAAAPAKSVVAAPPPVSAAPVVEAPAAAVDAGAPGDAGAPRLVPLPKASAAASGEPSLPPNPFDKWKVYERKKK